MRPRKAKKFKTQNPNLQAYNQTLNEAMSYFAGGNYPGAVQLGQQLVNTNPRDDQVLHMLGCCAQHMGDNQIAMEYLKKALQLNPNNPEYNLNMAITCFDALLSENEVMHYLNRALELHPNYVKAMFYLGKVHVRKHRHIKARDVLQKALLLDPGFIEIYELLCLTLERTNDLEELEKVINKGQELFPDNTHLLLPLAKLRRRQKKYDEAESCLETIKNQPNSKERLSTIYAELGRIYEARKEYDGAFAAFSEAQKNLKEAHEESGGVKDHFMNLRQAAVSGITGESIKEWQRYEINDGYPPMFLVGFPRSGTTLMEQILSAHPKLAASQEASILDGLIFRMANIIGHPLTYPGDLKNLTVEEITKLRAEYRRGLRNLFDDNSDRMIIDKLPYNLVHLGIIYRLFPEAKMIVMIRDPRDACLSCFMQTFRKNSAMKYSHSLESTVFLYDKTMEAYNHFKKFIPLQIMEIRYEDLVEDLEGKARAALDFYGLEWNDEVLRYYEKGKDRGVSTPSYEGVMQPIYKTAAGKWKNYEKHLDKVMPILKPYIKEFGYES